MNISSFDDLLRAAREEAEPQRLLFVFANAMLPDDSTPEQRLRFETGQGGALAPLMSVDKIPGELTSFAALVEESRLLRNIGCRIVQAEIRFQPGARSFRDDFAGAIRIEAIDHHPVKAGEAAHLACGDAEKCTRVGGLL